MKRVSLCTLFLVTFFLVCPSCPTLEDAASSHSCDAAFVYLAHTAADIACAFFAKPSGMMVTRLYSRDTAHRELWQNDFDCRSDTDASTLVQCQRVCRRRS